MERILAYSAKWDWKDPEPRPDILPLDWKTVEGTPGEGELKKILVVRPAFLTDGECKAELKKSYRAKEGDVISGYSISRKDVAHFIVEGALEDWEKWENKYMTIAY